MSLPVMPRQSDRLNDVRGRLSELRKRRGRAQEHVNACKQALNGMTDVNSVNSEEFKRAERAIRDLDEIKQSISLTEEEERFCLASIAGVDGGIRSESFLSDPAIMEDLRVRAEGSQPIGDLLLGQYKSRDEMINDWQQRRLAVAGDVALPSDAARTQFYGITPPITRPLHMTDLIPTAAMEVGSFSYLQETATSGAAESSELTVKPSGTITLTDAVCKAVTIPEWVRVSRQVLSDVPGLGNLINTQLQFDVESRLDSQILNGDGTGQNLTGVLHTAGIGAPASVAGDVVNADLVLNGINSVIASFGVPNGIVMNFSDVMKSLKAKAATSGDRLDSDGAFSEIPTTMWGLPLVATPAIAAGTAVVGDWARAATVFMREAFFIRASDSDSSDFTSNAIKVLGELRCGLAIWRPSYLAKVNLSFTS